MWHTDALDTLDAHLGILSRFSNVHNQSSTGSGDLWITSITISQWRLQGRYKSYIRKIEDEVEAQEKLERGALIEKAKAEETNPHTVQSVIPREGDTRSREDGNGLTIRSDLESSYADGTDSEERE